jgi:hypothetical protein
LTPAQQLTAFLSKYDGDIQRTARAALAKLRKLLPGAIELVYDNYNALVIGFGPSERASDAIVSIALYPKWVTLFFLEGHRLRDPHKLLGGGGKIVRQIRLESAADLDRPEIVALIEQAADGAQFVKRRLVIKSISAKQRPRRPAR